ncbi:zinc finger, GRF-type [Artemisia annua]|uniref:Zinc finger, GRF-type n=1 Tax=Artemisia annua TaxID=35608 RepID=A0A2U1LXS0_ARTAN|nr:zinc finger, GRF-type [Artemisia annua]
MAVVRCHYGRVAIVKTSWTNANPGRRFYSCPIQWLGAIVEELLLLKHLGLMLTLVVGFTLARFKIQTVDGLIGMTPPPMCNRSLEIIPGLLRSRNNLERAIIEAQNGRAKMKKCLIWSWILFVVLFSIK